MLSFLSLDDRSGFDFLDSEVLPLLEVELEDEFESFCLDLEEPLPFSVLELSDLFSDLFPEVLEAFSWETSALCSQYRESIAWMSFQRLESVVGLSL